jgi:hypothetical protein
MLPKPRKKISIPLRDSIFQVSFKLGLHSEEIHDAKAGSLVKPFSYFHPNPLPHSLTQGKNNQMVARRKRSN